MHFYTLRAFPSTHHTLANFRQWHILISSAFTVAETASAFKRIPYYADKSAPSSCKNYSFVMQCIILTYFFISTHLGAFRRNIYTHLTNKIFRHFHKNKPHQCCICNQFSLAKTEITSSPKPLN